MVSGPPKVVKYLSNFGNSIHVHNNATAADACGAMGYEDGIGDGYSLPFDNISGFQTAKLEDNTFSAASALGAGGNGGGSEWVSYAVRQSRDRR